MRLSHVLLIWMLVLLLAFPVFASSTGQIDTEDIRDDAITDAEVDWGTGTGQVNAADVPVIDAAAHYVATTVEGVLTEIGTWLTSHPNYWQRITGPVTGLRPLAAGDDLYLGSNEQAVLQSSTSSEQKLSVGVIGDSYPRAAITAAGTMQFGSGAAATDISLYRTAADHLKLDDALTAATSTAGAGSTYTDLHKVITGDANGQYSSGVTGDASGNDSYGIIGNCSGTGSYGVAGTATGATSDGVIGYSEERNGVVGVTGATGSNDTYGGTFTRTRIGSWADLAEQGTHPAAPSATYSRVYASSASITGATHLWQRNSSGSAIDLVSPVVFQVDGRSLATGASGTYWRSQKSAAAALAATISPSATSGADYTNRYLTTCLGQWAWTSTISGGYPAYLNNQSDMSVGFGFAKRPLGTYPADQQQTSRVIVRARIKVNDTTRLASLYLVLNDVGATGDTPANGASSNVLGSLTSGQWAVVTLAATGTDVSSWGDNLRCGLIAYGTTIVINVGGSTTTTVGATTVSVEWISAELYPL